MGAVRSVKRLAGCLLPSVLAWTWLSGSASGSPGSASGSPKAPPAEGAPVVVGPVQISSDELAARLAQLSPDELRRLGSSPGAARLGYVERVLVPELLLQAEAERLALAHEAKVRARLRDALASALVSAERAELPEPTDDELAQYYEEHRRDFERPERIALWRILVSSEAEARSLLASLKNATPERWRAETREHSRDTATKERGGDLGFVHPDGATDVPELRVDPVLFEAARDVEDGALVPRPVREGERFAVVWRRGSQRPTKIPLASVRSTIQQRITERKLAQRIDAQVRSLATIHVHERHDELLSALKLPETPGR